MPRKKPSRRKQLSKEEILKVFLDFVQKNKCTPSKVDLVAASRKRVTISMVQTHFGSLAKLEEYTREQYPEIFKDVVDERLFTKKNFRRLQKEVGKFDRFVITTAVTGCKLHDGFFQSLKTYCDKNKALLLVIPVSDPAHHFGTRGNKKWPLDSDLAGEYLVFDDLSLNSNLNIRTIKTSAKMIDPITGLARLGQRDGSFIYGSPKQRLRFIPVGESKLPHALMTTGAVTIPNYTTENYFSLRTAVIAEHDHVLGAIVVEVDNEAIFHFRQLQAEPKSGQFVDLGAYYGPNGSVERMEADTFVLGDYHAGEHDLTAKKAWKEVVKQTGVKNLVIHDIFNGKSICHHERNKTITRARQTADDLVSLENEITVAAQELNDLCTWVDGDIIITKSNHDEWLERYLQDGIYVKELQNLKFASQLIAPFIDGADPLRYAIEELVGLTDPEKLKWLARDDSYKIFGIELGAHGDRGSSGSRGSMKNIEEGHGSCVIGHVHTPEILRDVWRVGTTSILDPDYIKGSPSGWFHTSCLIYPNGSRQMINSIEGKWRKK